MALVALARVNDEPPAFDADRTVLVLRAGARCFGRFWLVRKLGEGGMGVVWLARDEKLEREVALKFLPENVRQDAEAVRDLKREVKRCLDLAHDNIVRVHDFVEDATAAAITMEYVPGRSLATRKAEQPGGCCDAAFLAPLVAQLAAALDYAHVRKRIVHRDLKPGNLLVTDAGGLKIVDFGIARSLSETRTRITEVGRGTTATLSFASPQQISGDAPSTADDIYALGATLYDLLTGKPPFFRGDVAGQIHNATPARLGARRAELENAGAPIPRAWEETILACLAKRAADRPASAGDVARRLGCSTLDAAASETSRDPDATEPIEITVAECTRRPAPSDPERTPRGPRRLWAGIVIALATGVLAAVWWSRKQPEAPIAAAMGSREPPQSSEGMSRAAMSSPTTIPPTLPREFTVIVDPPDAGAHVWLGSKSNLPVPIGGRLRVSGLDDGDHNIIVQAEGYQAVSDHVRVVNGEGAFTVRLRRLSAGLSIAARPGTTVIATDENARAKTIGIVPAEGRLVAENILPAGRYRLDLTHPDCGAARLNDVDFSGAKLVQLSPSQLPLPGEVHVYSKPNGASVFVNGTEVGVTPADLSLPSETVLHLEVALRGYRRISQGVVLKPRAAREVDFGALVAEAGTMELRFAEASLRSDPKLVAKLDGGALPRPTGVAAWVIGEVAPGEHRVEFDHPDYESFSARIAVQDRQISRLDVRLVPKPASVLLSFPGTAPAAYALYVDGTRAAVNQTRTRVPAKQELALEVRATGFLPAARKITLPANGDLEWEVRLEPQQTPLSAQSWINTLGMKFVPVPGAKVLFCVWETRMQDFRVFVNATHYDMPGSMLPKQQRVSWKNPGFPTTDKHPVVVVSQEDARAFCQWLTKKERTEHRLDAKQEYRLPTDAEWDSAVGKQEFPWGSQWPPPAGAGNYGDEAFHRSYDRSFPYLAGYDDGIGFTAPVGSFPPNAYGIFDLGGNVSEYVDERPLGTRGACFGDRVRGGLASAYRATRREERTIWVGFRVVLVVEPAR